MKSFLIFLLLITTISLFGQTQADMNEEADQDFKEADAALNSMYNKILKSYAGDALFIKNLKTAQRAWIAFRDAEVKMKYPDPASYGSILPMCYSYYMTDLTNARMETLQIWLDGIEEGDACAGSVITKE